MSWLFQKRNVLNNECLSCLFLFALLLSRWHVVWNIPWPGWVSFPGYVPSQDLALTPSLLVRGGVLERQPSAAPALLSSSQDPDVFPLPFQLPVPSATRAAVEKMISSLGQAESNRYEGGSTLQLCFLTVVSILEFPSQVNSNLI